MRASCSPTAAASSCRGAIRRRSRRRSIGLLDDPTRSGWTLRQRAAETAGRCCWPAVARQYVDTFERARGEHAQRRAHRVPRAHARHAPAELPEVNLEHVRAMTDDTGILQHADFNVPRYDDGYCLDDNARALLLMALSRRRAPAIRGRARARRRGISRSSTTRSTRRAGASATS